MITVITTSQKTKNVAQRFFMFFFAALFSILVPVAHFVLVPTFLLLSIVMPYLEFKKKYLVQNEKVKCNQCRHETELNGTFKESSVRLTCQNCRNQYYIELK